MKLYPKLALDGIRKNRRLYIPYLLTCIGMVMMYYIILFLGHSEATSHMRGADMVRSIVFLGSWVIAVFACIFLFYTNSFLMRRRKKEFGLYNILGMGKWNIAGILFWESLMIAVFTLFVGLLAGIIFSKLAELGLINIMHGEMFYPLSVSPDAIYMTLCVFGGIFLLLFLNALRQIRFSSAISLLHSENLGEKPPKGNWLLGVLGISILGAAYYIAVTIENPVTALVLFFVAVIMVIVGTYLIMIAGSVCFCRLLQKNKSYYYKRNHFVSVASMVYRMKRNGAGLASICILATMVLVMISSTTSLYFGGEDSLRNRYPRDTNLSFYAWDISTLSDANVDRIRDDILTAAGEFGVVPEAVVDYRCAYVTGLLTDEVVETDVTKINDFNLATYANVYQFWFVPLSDYNAMMGTEETLAEGEAFLYVNRGDYTGATLSFINGKSFQIKKKLDDFVSNAEAAMLIVPSIMLVVPDLAESVKGLDALADYYGNRMVSFTWNFNFDTGLAIEEQESLHFRLLQNFSGAAAHETYGYYSYQGESRELERADFYSLNGSFFYLGIFLSLVFLFAAVLIIYYKQISEGYEDQARFDIMQKVGMTGREIKKNINSQLLCVFFLPLALAACHLAFAFPIISKLLLLFNLNNNLLFAGATLLCLLVFALFYAFVYKITSNAYYRIVSGAWEVTE